MYVAPDQRLQNGIVYIFLALQREIRSRIIGTLYTIEASGRRIKTILDIRLQTGIVRDTVL